jgi:hypothetical protein
VLALLAVLFLVVFILLAALVLKWSHLVLLQRNVQQRSDLIALAATAVLLDEDQLRDADAQGVADQSDDVAEAFAIANRFRRLNNCLVPHGGLIDEDDICLSVGHVADVPAGQPAVFRPELDPNVPLNTIRVACLKDSSGPNPVSAFVRSAGRANASVADAAAMDSAAVSGHAQATLDNLVVGFRPTIRHSSPLLPIAVGGKLWRDDHSGDQNDNGIAERELRLAIADGDKQTDVKASSKLVAFSKLGTFDECRTQMLIGVEPEDLPGGYGALGPATSYQPLPLPAITIPNVMAAERLVDRINEVATSDEPRRALCVYGEAPGGGGGEVSIVGFVAACVLAARIDDDQVIVTVEPCYLIHPTLWTASLDSPPRPKPNLYLHKLRLTR